MADTNSSDKQEKRFIEPETGAPSGTSSSGGVTGAGAEAGNQTKSQSTAGNNGGEKPDTKAVDTGHSEPGGNIGGRGPGSSSKTIGDQDSTQARNDMDTVDPMTGRAPGQLDKVNQQDNSKEQARRDP